MTLRLSAVQRTVASRYGISIDELTGPSRKSQFARPRMIAMILAREFTGLSFPAIGNGFSRDHTTVIHACRSEPCLPQNDLAALRAILAVPAELAQLDALSGRVYLACEAQWRWPEPKPPKTPKPAPRPRKRRLRPVSPPVPREAWIPGNPIPSAWGEM